MKRRSFLKGISAVPFVGAVKANTELPLDKGCAGLQKIVTHGHRRSIEVKARVIDLGNEYYEYNCIIPAENVVPDRGLVFPVNETSKVIVSTKDFYMSFTPEYDKDGNFKVQNITIGDMLYEI